MIFFSFLTSYGGGSETSAHQSSNYIKDYKFSFT